MSSDSELLRLEISHVLFMDLVGYSREWLDQQPQLLQRLQIIVQATKAFREATDNQLIPLPTGDGMALVFFVDPLAPLRCAIEISKALAQYPELKLRMGINSGPVFRMADINANLNVSGGGINMAQRVMDCADAGHILISKRVADDLGQLSDWADSLHDLGEVAVKHGVRLHVFNFYTTEVGNVEVPIKFRSIIPTTTGSRTTDVDMKFRLEPPGGSVPLDSQFYIVRPIDKEFLDAIKQRPSIVLVKGARQMGKTSLLARGLKQARSTGAKVILTDLQMLNADHLESLNAFFLALARMMADQLKLNSQPHEVWNPREGPNRNFGNYIRREVLSKVSGPLVWAIDEVDRLLSCVFCSEAFALFRSWHNERSLDPNSPLERLTLAMAYATEPYLFITDPNQSPFNVGTKLEVRDFTLDQVMELNSRYGASPPLREMADVARFYELIGGHPYLSQQGLYEMAVHKIDLSALEESVGLDYGPFADHMRHILSLLDRDVKLREALREVLQGQPCPTRDAFFRLRTSGILSGDSQSEAKLRCQLYAKFLGRHLLS